MEQKIEKIVRNRIADIFNDLQKELDLPSSDLSFEIEDSIEHITEDLIAYLVKYVRENSL